MVILGLVRVARALSACCVLALLVVACSSGGGKHSAPTTTTSATIPASAYRRSDVVDIKVISLPESPVLYWTAERKHWSQVLAMLPTKLPPQPTRQTCSVGPALIMKLKGGGELDYTCKLPPAILATRNYIISVGRQSAAQ